MMKLTLALALAGGLVACADADEDLTEAQSRLEQQADGAVSEPTSRSQADGGRRWSDSDGDSDSDSDCDGDTDSDTDTDGLPDSQDKDLDTDTDGDDVDTDGDDVDTEGDDDVDTDSDSDEACSGGDAGNPPAPPVVPASRV